MPVKPENKTFLNLAWYWAHWIVGLVFFALLFIQVFPQVIFDHKLTAHGITVYSRAPLPPQARDVLAKAALLVAQSKLAIPGRGEHVYVADQAWVMWLFQPFRTPFAVSVPVTNNIFVAQSSFVDDTVHANRPTFNTRTLSSVIAHEIGHDLVNQRLGPIQRFRVATWVAEGYCDYIAKESSFPEQEGMRLLAAGKDDPSSSFRYFVARKVVAYLIERKGMSFEQIAVAARESATLRDETLKQMHAEVLAKRGA